uniref:DUF4345 domain-containing protein n=1 Tax=Caulobacter sp. (strain K31) TaxID=366602 RepID=B0SY55_CAUSK
MIRSSLRLLIGLVGVLALLVSIRLWIAPAKVGAILGLTSDGLAGTATLRADVAGFFAGMGLFSLLAALRSDRQVVVVPLVLVGLALAGRLLNAALLGLPPQQYASVAIEAALVVLFLAGRRAFAAVDRI